MRQISYFTGLLVAIVLLSLAAYTQDVKGTVTDSTGAAIPYATVTVKSKPANIIIAYAITDVKGSYQLQLPAGFTVGDLYLEVRCVGYKSQSKLLTGLPSAVNFSLPVSVGELEAVVVRRNRP